MFVLLFRELEATITNILSAGLDHYLHTIFLRLRMSNKCAF